MPASAPIVEVRRLNRYLGEGEGRVHVLRDIDLSLDAGQTYSIVGPSGCGKSTLLYLLGLLDLPDSGEIHLNGIRADNAGEAERTRLRGALIGFVFQFHFLLAEFTALENILLPLLRQRTLPENEARAWAEEVLCRVGLRDKLHRRGNQLSGGEQQRVAVARALANKPPLLLADEPTGNLDQANSEALFALLHELAATHNQTILLVTHNPDLAQRCHHTLPMRDGRFV